MQNKPVASITRRLLATFYDLLLLLGILLTVSTCAVAINQGAATKHPVYYLALFATAYIFYGWFWTHDGQTLGMRTWKIKIITDKGEKLTWKQSAIRFAAATAIFLPAVIGLLWLFDPERSVSGLTFATLAMLPACVSLLWMFFDSEKLAWHDKLSSTRLISLKVPGECPDDNNQHGKPTSLQQSDQQVHSSNKQ